MSDKIKETISLLEKTAEQLIKEIERDYRDRGLNENQIDFLSYCWIFENGHYINECIFKQIDISIAEGTYNRSFYFTFTQIYNIEIGIN